MATIRYKGVESIDQIVYHFLNNDEMLINNPVFAGHANSNVLKSTLTNTMSQVKDEAEFESMLTYKNLLFNQLVHYCDTLKEIPGLDNDLNELLVHRIFLGTELKILVWIFKDQYSRDADMSNPAGDPPRGFLRYLKLNCKSDTLAHFLGLAMQQFIRAKYPEEELYQNESFFKASYTYLCELVMEREQPESIAETIAEQQKELAWLRDELLASEKLLEEQPDNKQVQERQQKLILDFMTERLEMELLWKVIMPLF